jgi:hypothetical protein
MQNPQPSQSYFNTIHKSARDKLTRLVNDLRSLASKDKNISGSKQAQKAKKSSAAAKSAATAATAASTVATRSTSAVATGPSSSAAADEGSVAAALTAEKDKTTGADATGAAKESRTSHQKVHISTEHRQSFLKALDESLDLPMMQVSVAKPGVDKFYEHCDTSSGNAQYTKLLVAEPTKDPYDGYYYVPEAFTSLLFRRASVMKLATERRHVPDHISCIVGEGQAYGPLFYQIGVRSHVFRNLRTLALLVPTVTEINR